ncbi:hypothetical protein U732_917 [Clostridium argentinense CDC 2741]|uniref:Uncharacterized protein n=1 Tax=Clostridium argentinense CDC 2741 TaxID=1418104 RepID=A0A0C1TWS0_9CLOT|nr:hypothetical protein [Clostridium argentinense]ARC84365.1 hypothetical protein RSJ17_07380 [Clostridium argentinense]KIE45149.1 hypothetical protein U732_917 [Clostridium argentinense CDC 2741]NFF38336.1 hypothetical protein [Clostridium argentinense]NFP49080.1 hypothetical protein [Clostridium argentinense]NFP71640.1 hypothetical protein [Clostridium argentinense]
MVNESVVKIIGERILNKGINPKTETIYKLDDITDIEYKRAVQKYISSNKRNEKTSIKSVYNNLIKHFKKAK